MITRQLNKGDAAVRYLLARGFPTRKDAEEALDDIKSRDYGALRNEAGANLTWTVHGGFTAGYRTTREALEAEAVDEHVCPRCRAGVGNKCCKQVPGVLPGTWYLSVRLKHPHAERVAKAKDARRLSPFVETRRG